MFSNAMAEQLKAILSDHFANLRSPSCMCLCMYIRCVYMFVCVRVCVCVCVIVASPTPMLYHYGAPCAEK